MVLRQVRHAVDELAGHERRVAGLQDVTRRSI